MHLHLGGHLSWYAPQRAAELAIELTAPTPLVDIASRLGLPAAEIAFAAVNGVVVPLRKAEVRDADRVELFPPNCGG
jgi:sulfur carrier protein ThiS